VRKADTSVRSSIVQSSSFAMIDSLFHRVPV
jgi:hypothetical protein